jgi:hypothetical protein
MTDLNEADQNELDDFFAECDSYSKYPSGSFHYGQSNNSQINSVKTAVPETEASENEVEDPPAQDATTVDQERVSAITKFILYSRDASTLHRQDQSFATHLKGSYRTQAIAAMADPNGSVFSELETEIENKVTTHIERSELGKSQVKTIFHAVSHPETKPSLEGCPPGSKRFVRGMIQVYGERMKHSRTRELWEKIGKDCTKFVQNPNRIVSHSKAE